MTAEKPRVPPAADRLEGRLAGTGIVRLALRGDLVLEQGERLIDLGVLEAHALETILLSEIGRSRARARLSDSASSAVRSRAMPSAAASLPSTSTTSQSSLPSGAESLS